MGDAMHKGISGGQMKRLSIAVEIVALPNLIFLDGKLQPVSNIVTVVMVDRGYG